ncbi:vanadium-dependent haloperoxidase [Yinghuangia seranimata]|uniref:vanadium-dependent haloperoxidase n=1 Tax=Yinghuangia seranimata TaxID=408067 RepID=UPI00248AB2CB|nr:vanadium-dependent haloperoxidase [Yinghuangia seranimata]MDI2128365.1 vanadium-dependent haloperoxidase [Yinghuangia seranimata]
MSVTRGNSAEQARTCFRLRKRAVALAATMVTALGSLALAPQAASAAPPNYTGDPTQYWNSVLLEMFRRSTGATGSPGMLARSAAMMNAAVFDAESAYQNTFGVLKYKPYIDAPKYWNLGQGADEEERVIGRTAYNILHDLYPGQTAYLDQKFLDRFGTPSTQYDVIDTQIVGKIVTDMRQNRAGDGYDNPAVYTLDNQPGAWRPTGNGCATAADAVTPNWGLVKPFAMTSGSQFRPNTPATYGTYSALLASPAYAAQVDKVRRLGGASSTERTSAQTALAWFWANDLGPDAASGANGTYKPPGQLLKATMNIAAARGLSKYENTRLFALVSLAMADAAIGEWDVKYQTPIDLWRPQSAIVDGGVDTAWQPLSADRAGTHFSPCFPAWASGHAAFGGAWAGIMKLYFKTDSLTYTVDTEDPHSPVHTMTYTSFSQAARDDADSRIWLGVHYQWDADDGLKLGDDIAKYVFANKLTAS